MIAVDELYFAEPPLTEGGFYTGSTFESFANARTTSRTFTSPDSHTKNTMFSYQAAGSGSSSSSVYSDSRYFFSYEEASNTHSFIDPSWAQSWSDYSYAYTESCISSSQIYRYYAHSRNIGEGYDPDNYPPVKAKNEVETFEEQTTRSWEITYEVGILSSTKLVQNVGLPSFSTTGSEQAPSWVKTPVLSTTATNQGWTTTTVSKTGSRIIGKSNSNGIAFAVWPDGEIIRTLNWRERQVTAVGVTAWADPTEIGLYFSSHDVPFTQGSTIPPSGSVVFSFSVGRYETVDSYESIVYDEYGEPYPEERLISAALCPVSYYTTNGPLTAHTVAVLTHETAAFPRSGWGVGEVTSYEAVTLYRINTSLLTFELPEQPYPDTETSSSESSYSVFSTKLEIQENTRRGGYTYGSTTEESMRSVYEHAYGHQHVRIRPVPTTLPVNRGSGYLVASTQTGCVVPNAGFHTRAPNKSIAPDFQTVAAMTEGNARPGVLLHVPFGAPTPGYSLTQATYIGGQDLVNYNYTTTTGTPSVTYAFKRSGFDVSPSIVIQTISGVSLPQTSTIMVNGSADEYGVVNAHAGGYSEESVTWTFVAQMAGVLVVYKDTTSETHFFSSPTTQTFASSEGGLFSFLPCIPHTSVYGDGDAWTDYYYGNYGRLSNLPLYNYEII